MMHYTLDPEDLPENADTKLLPPIEIAIESASSRQFFVLTPTQYHTSR